MSEPTCRIDAWLWRARMFKTRSAAARFVDEGRVRLTREGREGRVEKAARNVRPGDLLVFAVGGRVRALRIEAIGARRGPPVEARAFYTELEDVRPPTDDEPQSASSGWADPA